VTTVLFFLASYDTKKTNLKNFSVALTCLKGPTPPQDESRAQSVDY